MILSFLAAAPASADPSPNDVRRQQAKARQLDQQAAAQQRQVSSAQAQLQQLSAAANAALDELQRASAQLQAAQAAATAAQQRLAAATARVTSARTAVAQFAASAYMGGGITSSAPTLALLTTSQPTEYLQAMGLVHVIGDREAQLIAVLRNAQNSYEAASIQAQQTVAIQQFATNKKKQAKLAADAAVADAQQLLASVALQLAHTRVAALSAHQQAAQLARALAIAQARARAAALAAARARASAALCLGGDLSGYQNGYLPISKLCALWGAPDQELRKEAAASFNRMSKAYAAVFGEPMCVNSAYRTYAKQIELYETEPQYAAKPGTSTHGWALAVDLGCGIQTDGTAQNSWMRLNAPAYGWFHPSWADPGGAGPYEPWHWEYAE